MTIDFYIAEVDRLPSLLKTLKDSTGTAINLSSGVTDVIWTMYDFESDDKVIDSGVCTIVAPAANGVVRYDWTLADSTLGSGFYYGRFTINYSDGRAMSIPNDGWLIVKVSRS